MPEYQPKASIRGSANGKALLNADEVREIRRLTKAGATGTAIARQYGVSAETIYHITSRRNWDWLPDEEPPSGPRVTIVEADPPPTPPPLALPPPTDEQEGDQP